MNDIDRTFIKVLHLWQQGDLDGNIRGHRLEPDR